MHRNPHILNAATNLLGICFVVIGSLKLSNRNGQSLADEAAWVASILLFYSTIVSYLAIRNQGRWRWQVVSADWAFLAGVTVLFVSVLLVATTL